MQAIMRGEQATVVARSCGLVVDINGCATKTSNLRSAAAFDSCLKKRQPKTLKSSFKQKTMAIFALYISKLFLRY